VLKSKKRKTRCGIVEIPKLNYFVREVPNLPCVYGMPCSSTYWIPNYFFKKEQEIREYFTCILVNSFLKNRKLHY